MGINRFQNFIVDYTRSQGPSTVIAGRVGVLRAKSLSDPVSYGFDAAKELGVTPLVQAAGVLAFPAYSTGYRAMGPAGYAIIHRFEDVYQASGSVTKIIGGHNIKAGVEYRKYHENYFQPNTPQGASRSAATRPRKILWYPVRRKAMAWPPRSWDSAAAA